ncbi:MAG: polysaccharide deacetylase family protein [Vagococcus sp.]|uniref:polysaccharide deacetylase family protein n=1 Tax=Vagococcus sp. TaxID=1933889 RepID=UPI002FCAD200
MKKKLVAMLIVSGLLGGLNTITLAESSAEPVEESTSTIVGTHSSSNDQQEIMTTTDTSDKEIITPSLTIKSSHSFQPEKYGVITNNQSHFYDSIEDAKNGLHEKDTSLIENKLVKLTELFTSNEQEFYAFTTSDNQQGIIDVSNIDRVESKNFVTFSTSSQKKAYLVYKDTTLNETIEEKDILNKTYSVQEEVTMNEKTFLSLFNVKKEFIGFVNKELVTETVAPQGEYQHFLQYINITQPGKTTYQNFNFDKKNTTDTLINQTFYAKGRYFHSNGTTYLSIFNKDNKWIGYIEENHTKVADGKQGNYHAYGKYVNLTKKNYDIWGNFSWKSNGKASKYANKTLYAKGIYYHFNGSRYLSLYDNNNNWLGYINETGADIATGTQGNYYSYNKFITIKSKNYDFWNSFNWSKRAHSSEYLGKTFKARGIYYHFNGNKYLSVYDSKGKWLGYINQKATTTTKGPEGSYQHFKKYVSVTTSNYSIWQNFNWKKKSTTKNYKNQTLYAKGIYHHYNGDSYYSLYNNKDQWLGYVNKNGVTLADGRQGIYHSYWKNVTFSSNNYPIWRDFSWKQQNTSFKISGKTLMARGIYQHFNGSSYYTIYNGNTWIGYINVNAAQNYDMNKLIPNQESLLAVHQVVQQKILDSAKRPSNIIDTVLSMPTISRNQIKYRDNHFVVSLSGKGVGMDNVTLTPKEIAPAVNYRLLPANQIKGAIPKLNSGKKYVALTFDDGPNPNTTPQLLTILRNKNVKASFFMVGNGVNANPNIAKRVSDAGHQVGSHSYSHPQLTGLSASQIQNEMRRTDKAIYYATGKLPKTYRPPYGAVNRYVSNTVAKPAIMWSIDTRDWESRNPYMINNVVSNNIHNGAIILMHDIHQPTINSVSTMIDNLRRQGYQFVTVDELFEMQDRPLNGYFSQHRSVKY